MHDLEIFLYMHVLDSFAMLKQLSPLLLVVSSTHDNLVEIDAMQKCFNEMLKFY